MFFDKDLSQSNGFSITKHTWFENENRRQNFKIGEKIVDLGFKFYSKAFRLETFHPDKKTAFFKKVKRQKKFFTLKT